MIENSTQYQEARTALLEAGTDIWAASREVMADATDAFLMDWAADNYSPTGQAAANERKAREATNRWWT